MDGEWRGMRRSVYSSIHQPVLPPSASSLTSITDVLTDGLSAWSRDFTVLLPEGV